MARLADKTVKVQVRDCTVHTLLQGVHRIVRIGQFDITTLSATLSMLRPSTTPPTFVLAEMSAIRHTCTSSDIFST
ncbi:hypothetical protein BD777DRAFT_130506 [Yarrowia lipolytica]|nr:hypothetical protein BD777DRAFT_130506 [Yarrowia lipolytica]